MCEKAKSEYISLRYARFALGVQLSPSYKATPGVIPVYISKIDFKHKLETRETLKAKRMLYRCYFI
jgi:hypothetical protein